MAETRRAWSDGRSLAVALLVTAGCVIAADVIAIAAYQPGAGLIDLGPGLGAAVFTTVLALAAVVVLAVARRWSAMVFVALLWLPAAFLSVPLGDRLYQWPSDWARARETAWKAFPLDTASLRAQIEQYAPGLGKPAIKREWGGGRRYYVITVYFPRNRGPELRPAQLAAIARLALAADPRARAAQVGPGTFPRPMARSCTDSDRAALACGSGWDSDYFDRYSGQAP